MTSIYERGLVWCAQCGAAKDPEKDVYWSISKVVKAMHCLRCGKPVRTRARSTYYKASKPVKKNSIELQ